MVSFERVEVTLQEMEPVLTNAFIMVLSCSMDVVDKYWKGRINSVGDGAILDFCAVL